MALVSIILVVLLSVTLRNTEAQWNWDNRINNAGFPANSPMQANNGAFQRNPAFQNNGQSVLWNERGGQQVPQFLTCIGRNTNGDEMRTSFYYEQRGANRWNPWPNSVRPQTLRMFSLISTNINSQLQGEFQHVITEYSRVEDGCFSQALGNVLTDRSWWGQNRIRGIIGTRTTVYQGQSARSKEVIDNLQLYELIGRGLALCPANQLVGSTCRDLIPLCCKIGVDSQSVTPQNAQFNRGQQFGGQAGVNIAPAPQSARLNGFNMNGGNFNMGGK